MRTIITKETDGFQVVRGLDYPVCDSIATRLKAQPLFLKTEECDRQKQQTERCREVLSKAWQKAKAVKYKMLLQKFNSQHQDNLKDSAEYQTYLKLKKKQDQNPSPARIKSLNNAWNKFVEMRAGLLRTTRIQREFSETSTWKQYQSLQAAEKKKARTAIQEASLKRQQVFRAEAVYFTPRAGEEIISDEEGEDFEAELKILPPHSVLTRDKKIIPDFRQADYWLNSEKGWGKSKMEKLGELPPEAILQQDLTREQLLEIQEQAEEDRINSLSAAERKQEYDQAITTLTREMIFFRQELELEGVSAAKALKQAQDQLKARQSELKLKYGIETK